MFVFSKLGQIVLSRFTIDLHAFPEVFNQFFSCLDLRCTLPEEKAECFPWDPPSRYKTITSVLDVNPAPSSNYK